MRSERFLILGSHVNQQATYTTFLSRIEVMNNATNSILLITNLRWHVFLFDSALT